MIPAMILLILLLAGLIGVYYHFFLGRLFRAFSLPEKAKWVRCLLMVALTGCSLMVFSTFGLLMLHFTVFSAVTDLLVHLYRRIRRSPVPERPNRILACGLVPLALVACVLSYGYWNMNHVVETTYQIPTDKQLSQPYRAVLIADLHYGNGITGEKLAEQCDRISAQNPDFVLLDGDIVDENTSRTGMQEACALLGGIRTRYGIYYVYGNHGQNNYSSDPAYTSQELYETLTGQGIRVLAEDAAVINGDITLIGRSDPGFWPENRTEIRELLEKTHADPDTFWLVEDHQPLGLAKNAAAGVDLTVSGHTHAGQIFPIGLLDRLVQFNEMNYGCREQNGMYAVVTSGICGWGYPIRTEAHSEYVWLEIGGA